MTFCVLGISSDFSLTLFIHRGQIRNKVGFASFLLTLGKPAVASKNKGDMIVKKQVWKVFASMKLSSSASHLSVVKKLYLIPAFFQSWCLLKRQSYLSYTLNILSW